MSTNSGRSSERQSLVSPATSVGVPNGSAANSRERTSSETCRSRSRAESPRCRLKTSSRRVAPAGVFTAIRVCWQPRRRRKPTVRSMLRSRLIGQRLSVAFP